MEEGSLHELESQSFLTSTTTSLRFSGDFSDRYWICYFLDSQTQQADIPGGVILGERLRPSEDCGTRDDRDLGLMAAPHYNLDASERLYLDRVVDRRGNHRHFGHDWLAHVHQAPGQGQVHRGVGRNQRVEGRLRRCD